MLQSSLPTVVLDTGFTDRQPDHLPFEYSGNLAGEPYSDFGFRPSGFGFSNGSGGGNHTHLKKFMRLLSVL